ncbi:MULTISPECIES: GntR family transcriptional regulator [unclassified Brachybacterium]|uniref:GntR family transcriptional regulator n=1 Tax=unclassified Brachybacterium TaxID=2623841 RepID=UPI000C805A02|nr:MULTISPECIES: GntR family transcriptional regulator [unclassified Brachybacterium]PMC76825.1 GntR family transcriptional regulator [Brachybacterium sp. UMB0905]
MEFTSDAPIYVQIAEQIRAQILTGDLASGDQIMSTTQYATTYRINPATANKAFGQLVQEGLIEKRRGLGMFVTEQAADLLRDEGRRAYREQVLAPALERGRALGLTPEQIRDLALSILEES